jgi:hypothetical protein
MFPQHKPVACHTANCFESQASFTKLTGMLMKSLFAVMVSAACSANSATMPTFQKASVTKVVNAKPARTFNCHNANEYRFVVVENPNRKNDSDPVVPRDLNIVVGDEVISKIELPKESEVKNFSLGSIQKDKAGFELEVDWGSGVDHYEIRFNFRCRKNSFYLYRVSKVSFSTTNRDSGNFLDKKESKTTKIEPNLPIEKFVMIAYL